MKQKSLCMEHDYCNLTSGRTLYTILDESKSNVQRKMRKRTKFLIIIVAQMRYHHILWSPTGGTVWGGFGSIKLLEEIFHLRSKGHANFQWSSFCFLFNVLRYELSACGSSHHACLLPCFLAMIVMDSCHIGT